MATPTPAPVVPTLLPTPTPAPEARVNLRPVSGGAGELPLHVHVDPHSSDPGDLKTGGPVLMNWLIENASPFATSNDFMTDVFVDGIHINRWHHTQSPPFQKFGVHNWPDLNDKVTLDRGDHVFRLVVDSLNQINETNETDNVFEWTFTWGGERLAGPDTSEKAINLAPAPPDGLAAPVVVAPVSGAYQSGTLSVLSPTFISWGIENTGLASTDAQIAAHLYFDDNLVQRKLFNGLAASGSTRVTDWDELSSLIGIKPGLHTVRFVIDPGNFISESDESDNEYVVEIEWLADTTVAPPLMPIPTPVPAPEFRELTQPNLSPHTLTGWDDAIIAKPVSAVTGDNLGWDMPVSAASDVQVNYVVQNTSSVDATSRFEIALLLDDQIVDVIRASSLPSRSVFTGTHVIPGSSISPGLHELKLSIDTGSQIAESDEDDNVFTRFISFASGGTPSLPAPTQYSFSELRERLSGLPELLLETLPVTGDRATSRDWLPTILEIGDAGYFLATGTALTDERLTIELLPRDEYELRVITTCLNDQDTLSAAGYVSELARCHSVIEQSIGLQTHWRGRILILVDTDHTPAQVLSSLFHELGHARQELVGSQINGGSNSANSALKEAQAQVFDAVIWRHIEDFLEISVTSYPALEVQKSNVAHLVDTSVSGAELEEEHELGYVLMWATALQDPGGLGISKELRDFGQLSPESTLAMYDYLLTINASDAEEWVVKRLVGKSAFISEYEAIAAGRLVVDLQTNLEGHPDLRDVAFMAP